MAVQALQTHIDILLKVLGQLFILDDFPLEFPEHFAKCRVL